MIDGIIHSDELQKEKARSLIQLMESEYNITSSMALATLATNKFNRPVYLPLAQDVRKVTIFLRELIAEIMDSLTEPLHPDRYTTLAEAALFSAAHESFRVFERRKCRVISIK